jgi:hypothetical protein
LQQTEACIIGSRTLPKKVVCNKHGGTHKKLKMLYHFADSCQDFAKIVFCILLFNVVTKIEYYAISFTSYFSIAQIIAIFNNYGISNQKV